MSKKTEEKEFWKGYYFKAPKNWDKKIKKRAKKEGFPNKAEFIRHLIRKEIKKLED